VVVPEGESFGDGGFVITIEGLHLHCLSVARLVSSPFSRNRNAEALLYCVAHCVQTLKMQRGMPRNLCFHVTTPSPPTTAVSHAILASASPRLCKSQHHPTLTSDRIELPGTCDSKKALLWGAMPQMDAFTHLDPDPTCHCRHYSQPCATTRALISSSPKPRHYQDFDRILLERHGISQARPGGADVSAFVNEEPYGILRADHEVFRI
jgi:hypothetical protein